jgi:hypothetical protein
VGLQEEDQQLRNELENLAEQLTAQVQDKSPSLLNQD